LWRAINSNCNDKEPLAFLIEDEARAALLKAAQSQGGFISPLIVATGERLTAPTRANRTAKVMAEKTVFLYLIIILMK